MAPPHINYWRQSTYFERDLSRAQYVPLVLATIARMKSTPPIAATRLPPSRHWDEVVIRKVGEDVILSPLPPDWKTYLATAPVASEAFMSGIEDLPVQERDR